jgi:hypothetical protein
LDTARDLGSAVLWQRSLERSLARRGKPTRSSPELYRLRPERDLVYGDFIRESATYSHLRRSATRRPSMALPTAGGISALAVLAATTLPSLLGGRDGGGARHEGLTYRPDASVARLRKSASARHPAAPELAASTDSSGGASSIDSAGAAPSRTSPGPAAVALLSAAARTSSSSSFSSSIRASQSPTHGHPALAYDASASGGTSGGVVAHAVSGGAAPPSPRISAAAPRVPATPQPSGHPSTGGATVQERPAIAAIHPASKAPTNAIAVNKPPTDVVGVKTHTHTGATSHPKTTSTVVRPHAPARLPTTAHAKPVALPKPKPVRLSKPVPAPKPVAAPKPKPVVAVKPKPVVAVKPKPVVAVKPKPVVAVKPKPVAAPKPKPVVAVKPKPVAAPKPKPVVAVKPKPVAAPKPVAKPKPVATTKPAPPTTSAPPVAPGHYVNPLAGASVTPERIDQGVDYAGSGTLSALGAGRVTYAGLSGTGWPGAFIEYQLTGGPDSGRFVYYAEGVSPAGGLHVGETLQAGQPVAEIISGWSTGIEIGWGSGVGTQTLAEADGNWSGGDDADSVPSPEGKDFSALIASLGGPPGKIEG